MRLSLIAATIWMAFEVEALELQARNTVNATAQQQRPACVKTCAETVSQRYNCQPTEPCYCNNNDPYVLAEQECLKANCTLEDELAAKRFQADTCNLPVHDDQLRIRVVVYTLFAIAAVFTASRLLSRWKRLKGAGYGWDDWTAFISAWAMIAILVDAHFSLQYGLGKDMWTLDAYKLTHFLEWFYIAEPLYIIGTRLTKLSLVFLYLRIWEPEPRTPFQIACIAVAILLMASLIGGIFATLFQCHPVQYYWQHLIPSARGTCINQLALSLGNAVIVIFLDVCSLLLPLPQLWKLKVSLPTKAGISSVFLVGFAVTACSCVRMSYILQYTKKSTNITYDYTGLALWSHIEVYLSMICCSMPQIPGLLRRCWLYATNRRIYWQSTRLGSDHSAESAARYEASAGITGVLDAETRPHSIEITHPREGLPQHSLSEKVRKQYAK